MNPQSPALRDWKRPLVADLARVAARDRWGAALMVVGVLHLTSMLICQGFSDAGDSQNWHYLTVWMTEFLGVLATLRLIAGRGWAGSTPLATVLTRVWATFLILSFNLASMNTLMGLEPAWFKPALTTLSTFGFAVTAYLVDLRFFVPAVQMYFTGLLMVRYPRFYYAIYGTSWCIVLETLGVLVWLKGRRMPDEVATVPVVPVALETRPEEPGATRPAISPNLVRVPRGRFAVTRKTG